MANAKILIVEDEGIVALDLANRLRRMGYCVVDSVGSGERAIEQATEMRPDLVLMDIRLRGKLDGIEAAQVIRVQLDIPVIYLTALADRDTIRRAEMTHPAGYITKPFEDEELRATIGAALGRNDA